MPDGIPYAHEDGLWRYGGWENVDVRTGPKRNTSEMIERNEAIRALTAGVAEIVYAVQFSDGVIKIGCSKNLIQRLRDYRDYEIIGFRPGTYADEQAIHKSLKAHLHHGREWYHPTPEVFAVVNAMRDDFGLPQLAA